MTGATDPPDAPGTPDPPSRPDPSAAAEPPGPPGPPAPSARAAHPAVAALLADGVPPSERVGAFAAANTFPLVEPGRVTFAWLGEADRVELLRWINAGVDRVPLERLPDTRLWLAAVDVEDGGRFEYKLAIGRGDDEEWILDPLNPATAEDPFGHNSVCRTHGYERPPWSEPHGAPPGRIETIRVPSEVFGETREERVYVSAGVASGPGHVPCPLLVVHDGDDFVNYGSLAVSLDNLVAAGDLPPLVAALIQTGDRMDEYPRGRRHARYVARELLPVLEARFPLSDEPAERVLLGASLGAVASLSTAFRHPGVFGGLVLASGSFILDADALAARPHPVFRRVARLVAAMRRAPDLPATRAYVSTGELEGLADENRALAGFLEERGVEVRFDSAWDGHHWHAWRDRLRDALTWVLAPISEPGAPTAARDDHPEEGRS